VTEYSIFFVVPIDESQEAQEIVIESNSTTLNTTTTNDTNSTASNSTFAGVVITNYTVVESAEPPFWERITTNNQGEVRIYFSENMIRPSNFTNIDESILEVKIEPGGAVDKNYLGYTW
jgi:hypothetical protein